MTKRINRKISEKNKKENRNNFVGYGGIIVSLFIIQNNECTRIYLKFPVTR